MKPVLSVIICTHNPRIEYFDRVLSALKSQTLPMTEWELLIVDNASTQTLCGRVDLSWHPHARHVREERLGLTPARLCGIQAAQADTLVFVDDDNVLDSDYLEIAHQIGTKWPILGAWGGQAVAEFEEPPPAWTQPFWCKLAIREFDEDKWSNLIHQDETTPYGAGFCVRKTVAQKYAHLIETDPRRAKLGRTGKTLAACEDIDLAYTACDLGFGTGIFSALKLTHLIPPNRLQEEYLLKLIEGLSYSVAILESFRGKYPINHTPKAKLLNYVRRWLLDPRERRFKDAHVRGLNLAIQEIQVVSTKS
ncbi:glycosyltransferase [Chamaesiphon sp.]|uniref:glycosyltransferase n=1 Tax=Chamaesiphon sp. TaxID=2814140 RepID=UPI00359425B5